MESTLHVDFIRYCNDSQFSIFLLKYIIPAGLISLSIFSSELLSTDDETDRKKGAPAFCLIVFSPGYKKTP
jgi:hypothetical protein